VGGRNKLPMASLAATLESAGCYSVRTYIQSGNVAFGCSSKSQPKLSKKLGEAIEVQFGFRPNLLLLTDAEFRSAVDNNPFKEVIPQPSSLHFFFSSPIRSRRTSTAWLGWRHLLSVSSLSAGCSTCTPQMALAVGSLRPVSNASSVCRPRLAITRQSKICPPCWIDFGQAAEEDVQ
jgi:hypothetical protein